MSKEKTDTQAASHGRARWLDEETDTPVIHEYGLRLRGLLAALADGKIETKELKDQEARVVALMKKIEPELSDQLHEDVTNLLCELTADDIMRTLHGLMGSQPKLKFRG